MSYFLACVWGVLDKHFVDFLIKCESFVISFSSVIDCIHWTQVSGEEHSHIAPKKKSQQREEKEENLNLVFTNPGYIINNRCTT